MEVQSGRASRRWPISVGMRSPKPGRMEAREPAFGLTLEVF
jgi:hypothetical protein